MARFLIVGGGKRASALARSLQPQGHVLSLVDDCSPLGRLTAALDHVAIVCWLDPASPERFLLGAIDSSMRAFVYEPGEWESSALDAAARNSIPVAALRSDANDVGAWLAEARDVLASLMGTPMGTPGSGASARYAELDTAKSRSVF